MKKILLICFLFHLIFIPSVFGEGFSLFGLFGNEDETKIKGKGFSLNCPRNNYGELPVKFKFSEDKKTSWILLNDEWVSLETKITDSYYYLSGLVHINKCYNGTGTKEEDYIKFDVPFRYIIDRSTLRLFKKVLKEVDLKAKCRRPSVLFPQIHFSKGEDLGTFKFPCVVSKIKF